MQQLFLINDSKADVTNWDTEQEGKGQGTTFERMTQKVKEESEKVGLKLNIQKTKIMASGHGKQMGKQGKQCQTLFWGAPKSLQMVTAAMKLKDAYSLEGKLLPTQIAY